MSDEQNELDDSDFLDAGEPVKQKPSKDDLCKTLDYLVQEPVLANALRSIGYKPNTIFVWLKQSRDGNTKYLVRWPDRDGPEVWYHEAITVARRMQIANFDGILRRDVTLGTPRVLRQQSGEPVWEVDPLAIAQYKTAEDAAALGGLTDWPFVHDQTGARVACVVYDPSPAAIRQHMARSLIEGLNPADRREVDNHVSGGIMILKSTRQGDAGKPLPPYARERMTGQAERPARELSPLQTDLLARLEDLRTRGPAHAKPEGVPNLGNGRGGGNDPVERRTGVAGGQDDAGQPAERDPRGQGARAAKVG